MKLLFILTFKGSLEKWTREGLVTREMEVCFEYLRNNLFSHIQIYSYSKNDNIFLEKLNFEENLKKRIELIMPDKDLNTFSDYFWHSISLKKIKSAIMSGASISKTNQINGCWTALLAKLYGCPMFLRCGYILSRRLFKNGQWIRGIIALLIEIVSFNFASLVSVTTNDARKYIMNFTVYGNRKIFIAPTYVNTEIFNGEISKKPQDRKILYVGRFEPSKNTSALVDACKILNVDLTMVGRGTLQSKVLDHAKKICVNLTHFPMLMNEEIGDLLRSHRYFVLPSLHEGLPKVLIEAMSAEMICIGTPTSGITDLIIPGKTGYLAKDFSPKAIADAIYLAMNDSNAETYARQARSFVLERHSIKSYVDREYKKIREVIHEESS